MDNEKRDCSNCGNLECAVSIYACNRDDCVASNFTRNWMPIDGWEDPDDEQGAEE